MEWQLILPILSVIGLWLGFNEKRMADMRTSFESRLEEKNKVNEVIQDQLKVDLARIEHKLDRLIELQYFKRDNDDVSSS